MVLVSEGMFHTIQWIQVLEGASGSVNVKANDLVPWGGSLIVSSGFTSTPSHVNWGGIGEPIPKSGLVRENCGFKSASTLPVSVEVCGPCMHAVKAVKAANAANTCLNFNT